MTNNSQRVTYLDPPQNDGDDETTIVFKQHMNRIVSDPTNNEKCFDDSDDETNTLALLNQLLPDEETTQAYRHGRCGLCDKPVTTVDLNPNVELTCEECAQSAGNETDYVDPETKLTNNKNLCTQLRSSSKTWRNYLKITRYGDT